MPIKLAYPPDLLSNFEASSDCAVQEQAPPKPPVLVDVLPNHTESLLRDGTLLILERVVLKSPSPQLMRNSLSAAAPALLSSLDAGGPVMGQIPGEEKVKEKSINELEFQRTNAPMKKESIRQVLKFERFAAGNKVITVG